MRMISEDAARRAWRTLTVVAAGTALIISASATERSGSRKVDLPFPTGEVSTVNIIKWDANTLPRMYQRSDQLPLTEEELVELSAELPEEVVLRMIEERRYSGDASAEALIALRNAGVSTAIIASVSTHALRPNRHLALLLTFDFDGASRVARNRYLYVFIDDGDITRVYSADLGAFLASPRHHEKMIDKSDILIAREIRRVQLAGVVPLKTHGTRNVLVATSANPALSHPGQLTEEELERSQSYTFDYPASSLVSLCHLHVGYRRDAVLEHVWHFAGSRFECEWE